MPNTPKGVTRWPEIVEGLAKYAVTIVPIHVIDGRAKQEVEPHNSGSGTCIRIGGRFFIATAAHVLLGRPFTNNWILTPDLRNESIPILGGGLRGGVDRNDLDVGWLELAPDGAAEANRSFLDVSRIRVGCSGVGEQLAFLGAPATHHERDTHEDGSPQVTTWVVAGLTEGISDRDELSEDDSDLERRMYLRWPRLIQANNGETFENPEARGMSGGGVWAINAKARPWRPECVQLVGIEYAWKPSGVPDRYLKAMQMQFWLRMLIEDVPELGSDIEPVLSAVVLNV